MSFGTNDLQIYNLLKALQGSIRRLHELNNDHCIGWLDRVVHFPLHISACKSIIDACTEVEADLKRLDTVCKGGVKEFCSIVKYFNNSDAVIGDNRVFLSDIFYDLTRLFVRLSFSRSIWDTEFPLTSVIVNGITAGAGVVNDTNWKGGWVFSKLSPDHERKTCNCEWVREPGRRFGCADCSKLVIL